MAVTLFGKHAIIDIHEMLRKLEILMNNGERMKKLGSRETLQVDMSTATGPGTHIRFQMNDVKSTLTMMDENTFGTQRKNKSKKETRYTEINVTFYKRMNFSRACLNMDGRAIQIYGRPESLLALPENLLIPNEIEVLTFYIGKEKKKRVINAFYFENELPPATIHCILERYNHLYAIDTNTVNFKDVGKISFTTVYKVLHIPLSELYRNFSGEAIFQDYRFNVPGNPEVSAWQVLISKIQAMAPKPVGKIGIIVDSELGRLKDINSRREPLIEDCYLPPNFELIFASDKSGREEYFSNKIIALCEANSKRMLNEIERDNGFTRLIEEHPGD